MSDRTWVGPGKKAWANWNSSDYASLAELAAQMRWHLPAKVGGSDPVAMLELFVILDRDYFMAPDEFWSIWLVDNNDRATEPQCIEHPTWDELRDYLGNPKWSTAP